MTVGSAERDLLRRGIVKGRRILEEDFATTAEGRFGMHASGHLEDEASLTLTAEERAARPELVGIVQHLVTGGEDVREAIARTLREAAFTTLNRLVAIRVAETIGLLPPSLSDGRASRGFRDVLEVAPLISNDRTGGYWTYLRLCADELGRDAPVLFDPRNPLLGFEPSRGALDDLVGILADPALADLWGDPETFGWTYQYFNVPGEGGRDESAAPRNSRELAVRNQFFTPRYVVDFLVQNTLGRRLLESNPESALRDRLEMLVDPPDQPGEAVALEEIRVLDPAVGSGHFLLGCYDILEWVWEDVGVSAAEAARYILPCLWGIDIDPRCAQVAAAALMLRARRHSREGVLPRPNVFTARPLPADPAAWERALAEADGNVRGLVERIRDVLSGAPVLGSLLRVEEQLHREIERYSGAISGDEATLFGGGFAADAFGQLEGRILSALKRAGDEAASTAAERLLAAEATDALGFVEAARNRYDSVLMNPPFGEAVPSTRKYIRDAYPRSYPDLYAAFVDRGLDLLRPGGYLGAITSRGALFLVTFEAWRKGIISEHRAVAVADLGFGVMEGALVEAAAYVIGSSTRDEDEIVFLRLLRDKNRPAALADACRAARHREDSGRVFLLSSAELERLPGLRFAYWLPVTVSRLFSDLPRLDDAGVIATKGGWSGDDFRRLRLWWEVEPRKVGRKQGWANYVKGGEYSPFYSEPPLLVAWDDDRGTFKDFFGRKGRPSPIPESAEFYFKPGITWPRRTTSGFSPRILPPECVISDRAPSAFATKEETPLLLAWLTSRIARVLVDSMMAVGEETASGTAAKTYDVGIVGSLPWPGGNLTDAAKAEIRSAVTDLVQIRAQMDEHDETTRRFARPAVLETRRPTFEASVKACVDEREKRVAAGLDIVSRIEHAIHTALRLDEQTELYLDEEFGPNPASYDDSRFTSETETREFTRLYGTPTDKLIDEAIETRGGSRTIATKSYFLDRRLELLAQVFGRHPIALSATRRALGLLPPDEPLRSAEDVISWLVGCAFGRWDVVCGADSRKPSRPQDPFEPIGVCSPGFLVGEDGLPRVEAPHGYPLDLPPDGVLLDEEGRSWDIALRTQRAAEAAFENVDTVVEELETIVGTDLRRYLRRTFFKVHLARYSKSRRKAPIYWHLSVPSRDWGIWLYTPRLSRETLFAMVREARHKELSLIESVGRLRRDELSATGRERATLAKRLEGEERLLSEVHTFCAEAERVANVGWDPDLDDGVLLCAAPLASLFPTWPEAAKARDELRKGNHAWASVSKWAREL